MGYSQLIHIPGGTRGDVLLSDGFGNVILGSFPVSVDVDTGNVLVEGDLTLQTTEDDEKPFLNLWNDGAGGKRFNIGSTNNDSCEGAGLLSIYNETDGGWPMLLDGSGNVQFPGSVATPSIDLNGVTRTTWPTGANSAGSVSEIQLGDGTGDFIVGAHPLSVDTTTGDLKMGGANIDLNDDSLSGGGNINMDQGIINFPDQYGNVGWIGAGSTSNPGGISLFCWVGYELNWANGHLGVAGDNPLIVDNDVWMNDKSIRFDAGQEIAFNGPFDENWRTGLINAFTTDTIGAATSIQTVIGTGDDGPDGWAVGQTGGQSILELRGYDAAAYFSGNVTATAFYGDGSNLTGLVAPTLESTLAAGNTSGANNLVLQDGVTNGSNPLVFGDIQSSTSLTGSVIDMALPTTFRETAAIIGTTSGDDDGLIVYPQNQSQTMRIGYKQIISSASMDIRASVGVAQFGTESNSDVALFNNFGGNSWNFGADGTTTFPVAARTILYGATDDTSTPVQIGANGGVSLRTDGRITCNLGAFFGGTYFQIGNAGDLAQYAPSVFYGGVRTNATFDSEYSISINPPANIVPLSINLASGQSAPALQVNSFGGTAGDTFQIGANGDETVIGVIYATNNQYTTLPLSEPADGTMALNEVVVWVDQTLNFLNFKVMYADGVTVKRAQLALT